MPTVTIKPQWFEEHEPRGTRVWTQARDRVEDEIGATASQLRAWDLARGTPASSAGPEMTSSYRHSVITWSQPRGRNVTTDDVSMPVRMVPRLSLLQGRPDRVLFRHAGHDTIATDTACYSGIITYSREFEDVDN